MTPNSTVSHEIPKKLKYLLPVLVMAAVKHFLIPLNCIIKLFGGSILHLFTVVPLLFLVDNFHPVRNSLIPCQLSQLE